MIIHWINIKNLYGYMNKELHFNKDINLLVGINGSGKTSILNVVNWLLVPSLPNLCVTEYEKIEMEITFNKEKYRISSKQNNKEVTINVKNITKNYPYPPIQADFSIHPKRITGNNELKEKHLLKYVDLAPELHEKKTWNFLFKTLPNPIVIGLDRNLYTEEGDEVAYIEDTETRMRKSISRNLRIPPTPLENVSRLSGAQYMLYKNKILDLSKRLNEKIILSSFDEILTNDSLYEILQSPKISLKQIESLEIKVKNYFEENIIDKKSSSKTRRQQQLEASEKINGYFSNLKLILTQAKGDDKDTFNTLYITNVNQFRKIKDLIKEFEDFEAKSKKSFEIIKQYLETINFFLKDSSKNLYFDKINSKLKYRILDKEHKSLDETRDISTLSSGEKQILILFTYIRFNSDLGKLFIIDEPELSLHPKWQESFLDRIKAIMPSNTQLLFATHSPTIVGKNKNYCKVLLPY